MKKPSRAEADALVKEADYWLMTLCSYGFKDSIVLLQPENDMGILYGFNVADENADASTFTKVALDDFWAQSEGVKDNPLEAVASFLVSWNRWLDGREPVAIYWRRRPSLEYETDFETGAQRWHVHCRAAGKFA
jgi:hypothetical protein